MVNGTRVGQAAAGGLRLEVQIGKSHSTWQDTLILQILEDWRAERPCSSDARGCCCKSPCIGISITYRTPALT